jgi:DNA-binding transcriptional LysR family regulator
VRATDAGDRALAIAGRAIATWEHHVHDMMMLESGQLTPTQAGRRWLAKWRAGNRQLERYEDVAAQARQQRCL